MYENAAKIQAFYRGVKARKLFQQRLRARKVIQKAVYKYIQCRKWEREVESYAGNFLDVVIRI